MSHEAHFAYNIPALHGAPPRGPVDNRDIDAVGLVRTNCNMEAKQETLNFMSKKDFKERWNVSYHTLDKLLREVPGLVVCKGRQLFSPAQRDMITKQHEKNPYQ